MNVSLWLSLGRLRFRVKFSLRGLVSNFLRVMVRCEGVMVEVMVKVQRIKVWVKQRLSS